jgi:hypothetical protein
MASRQAGSRSAIQSAYTFPVRPATTSRSRAGRPADRSTMPVAYRVRRRGPVCCHMCSSTPRAVTPSSRQGCRPAGRRAPRRLATRCPPDAELGGAPPGHGFPIPADPPGGPAAGPLGQGGPRPDLIAGLRPCACRAGRLRTPPDPLRPHQQHRPPGPGHIPHPVLTPAVRHFKHPASATAGHRLGGLHQHLELATDLPWPSTRNPGSPSNRAVVWSSRHHVRVSAIIHLGPPLIRLLGRYGS